MFIIDSHLDLALNAIQLTRDLTQSVYTIRTLETALPREWGYGQGTVALPELSRGRVAVCCATLLARSTGHPRPMIDYPSPAQAYAVAQGHLAYYRALAAQGHAKLIGSLSELDTHLAAWEAYESSGGTPPPLGIVVSMESADPILNPADLPGWYAAGVRMIGPAHYGPGRYAGGTGTELGFSDIGFALLTEMERLNIALDLTHLADKGFWEALEFFGGVVVASHNNCRALVPHQRQFEDPQLRAIFSREGVVGVAFDNWMIRSGWTRTAANAPVLIAHVVEHIDHICQLAGNSRHAAIGSDLDGAFGREQSPDDLDTIADLQRVGEILASRGYADADIAAIMHGNWRRVLSKVLTH